MMLRALEMLRPALNGPRQPRVYAVAVRCFSHDRRPTMPGSLRPGQGLAEKAASTASQGCPSPRAGEEGPPSVAEPLGVNRLRLQHRRGRWARRWCFLLQLQPTGGRTLAHGELVGEPVRPPRNKAQGAPPTAGERGHENEQTETGLRNSLTPGLTPSPPHLIDPHFTFLRPNLAALLAFIAHKTLACQGPVPLQASLQGLPAPPLLRRHLGDLGPPSPPLWGLIP